MNEGSGTVEGIFIAPRPEELPHPVGAVEVVPGRGIRGDRKFAPEGTEWRGEDGGKDLTLIEAEALEGLEGEAGIALGPAASRRNLMTRGIGLNGLVGRRFRVGEVECLGVELCDPCNHLQKLTQPGVLRGLANRGGLRADVLNPGSIRVGDLIESGQSQPG